MKFLLSVLALTGFFACTNSPQNQNVGKAQHYTIFQFSGKPSASDMRDPGNWCAAYFGEAVLVGAAPQNFYRRLFALGDIPSKVVVDFGHMAASFMLNKVGDRVEIFTSDNLPACLSNKSNFQISPEGTSFRYDNKREISFDVYLEELPNGLQIAIDLPPNGSLGIVANRCEACK